MVKINMLRSKMALHGMTQKKVAKQLGISANTMSSRMTGRSSFTLDEVDKLCDLLKIREDSEKKLIFLD